MSVQGVQGGQDHGAPSAAMQRILDQRAKEADKAPGKVDGTEKQPMPAFLPDRTDEIANPKDFFVDSEKAGLVTKGLYQMRTEDGHQKIDFLDPAKDTARPAAASRAEDPAAAKAAAVPEDKEEPRAEDAESTKRPEAPKSKDADEPKDAKPEDDNDKKDEKYRTTTNTDRVDQEIRNLKAKKQQLAQQARAASPEDADEANRQLAQLERELAMKDNDQYRRQHASVHTEKV